MKKYAVTLDLYIWVDSDEFAKVVADAMAKKLGVTKDNQCKVVSIHDASGSRPVKIK